MPSLFYDYTDFTHFANYVFNFFLHCVFNNFSRFSSLDVTPFKTMVHCVCCLWNSLEQVWGSECAADGCVIGVGRHCVVVNKGN